MKNIKDLLLLVVVPSSLLLFAFVLSIAFSSQNSDVKQDLETAETMVSLPQRTEDVLSYRSNNPQIYFTNNKGSSGRGGVISLASTDEPAIYVGSYDTSGDTEIKVYRSDLGALLNFLVHDSEGIQVNKDVDTSGMEYVGNATGKVNSGYSNSTKITLPLEDTGIWYLDVKLGSVREHAFVVRSGFGTLVKEGDNEYIFWGQDYTTKRSITDGGVVTYNLQDNISELSGASFDAQGVAKTNLTSSTDIAIARRDDDVALVPVNLKRLNDDYNSYQYKNFNPKERRAGFFVFTDRPVYKPGDKVYFKSIIRDDDDSRYTIPSGLAQVKIYTRDRDKPLFERNLSISSDGTISGEFDLPVDAKTGYYYLNIDLDPGSDNYYLQGSNSFQVDYYRKPEYSLEITTSGTEYVAQDEAQITISGSYFFGQPLTNQEVKYKVRSSDFYEYEYLSSLERTLGDDYRYWYRYGSEVKDGSIELDEKGEGIINLKLELPEGVNKSQIFSVEVELDDGSGNPAFTRKNILVFSGEYGIFRNEGSSYAKVGDNTSIPLKLVSRETSSVSGIPLKAEVVRTNWVEYQEEGKKYPSYKREEENLPSIEFNSDSNGNANIYYTPEKEGSYEFVVEGKDSIGNTIIKNFHLWASYSDKPLYSGGDYTGLSINSNKEEHRHTDTVDFTLTSEIPNRDVFLSFDRARVNRYQVVSVDGNSTNIEIDLVETDIPNIFATVSSFSDNSLDTNSENVIVSTDPKKLIVEITPDKKEYGPGETVTVNVETTDTGGNPLSANTAVWAVDKALFELVSSNLGDIQEQFWKERYNGTTQAHSLQGINVDSAEGGGGCFAPETLVLMSDGNSKQIKDIVEGESVLTRRSEVDRELVSAKVLSVHEANVSGYFIINGDLKVTSIHRMWVNETWMEASKIQVGDVLLNSDGTEVAVDSLEWQEGDLEVYNLEIDKYNTFFAGGVWVHNQKGDGGRSIFKDTAYWNPNVQTDSSGRAQVTFKLPDNLTTWVLSSVGSTASTIVGQELSEIVVTKEVVIRPILPNIIRSEDNVVLSALVQNFTSSQQSFDVFLSSDSLEMISATDESNVIIGPSEFKQFYWEVRPSEVNENAELTFSVKSSGGNKLFDSVTVELPLRTFGFTERRGENGIGSTNYNVKLSEDSQNENTEVVLSLAPTLYASLPTAMEYLVDYPYGCVEQTTSRFVPAVIAKQNPDLFPSVLAEKDVDEIIEKGVIKLASLQKADGGWTWWYTGISDPFITSYVLEYLLKAEQAGIKVNNEIISSAKGYFETDERYVGENLWNDSNDARAARLYGLSLFGSDKAESVEVDQDKLTSDLLALVVMANVINGDTNHDTNGLTRLESMTKTQGDGVYWEAGNKASFGSNDASTALALRAIVSAGGDKELAAKASRYLLKGRRVDYWSNTFGTAQVVQGAVDYIKGMGEDNPNYSYTVSIDGTKLVSGNVNSSRQFINDIVINGIDISESGSKIDIQKSGELGELYSTLVVNEFRTDKDAKAIENGLRIDRDYVNKKGSDYTLGVGDVVTVNLTVSGLDTDGEYGVIADELPAGMVPINKSFKNEQYNYENVYVSGVSGTEVTENGMIMSLYKVPSGSKVYSYDARVVSQGDFFAPPAVASLMYSPEVYGRSGVDMVIIEKDSKLAPVEVVKDSKVLIVFGGSIVLVVALIIILKRRGGVKFPKRKKEDSSSNNNIQIPPVNTPQSPIQNG